MLKVERKRDNIKSSRWNGTMERGIKHTYTHTHTYYSPHFCLVLANVSVFFYNKSGSVDTRAVFARDSFHPPTATYVCVFVFVCAYVREHACVRTSRGQCLFVLNTSRVPTSHGPLFHIMPSQPFFLMKHFWLIEELDKVIVFYPHFSVIHLFVFKPDKKHLHNASGPH